MAQEPANVHLIGKTGAGKSTTGNVVRAIDHRSASAFKVGHGSQSETATIKAHVSQELDAIVWDTPGLADTSDVNGGTKSEEFFKVITENIYAHGGIVALVHPQEKISKQLIRSLTAMKMVLGPLFETSCILITTKMTWSDEDDEDEKSSYERLVMYQDGVEEDLNVKFAARFGYTTSAKTTRTKFLHDLKAELTVIPRIPPRTIMRWADVLAFHDNQAWDEKKRHEALEKEVARLNGTISGINNSIGEHEKVIHDAKIGLLATGWIPFGNIISGTTCSIVIAHHEKQVTLLKGQKKKCKKDLEAAEQALKSLDVSGLQKKADEVHALVTG